MVDQVGNHVHTSHPWRSERPESWFNEPGLCRDNDGWNVRPETCWFEPYLPDHRYEEPEVAVAVAVDAAWWVERADLDGFRVDAVKHMPHEFGYALRAYVDRLFADGNAEFFMLGETFVGSWSAEAGDLLKEYLGAGELDGQFDFPLYWELVRVLGRGEGGFAGLDRVVTESEAYYGSDAVMSSFLGNHDVPRFITHAARPAPFDLWGNGARELGWDDQRRPTQPVSAAPYDRMIQAYAFLMTMPSIPLVYYGDEMGLAGAGDPDNRRPFPGESGLTADQERLRDAVGTLGRFRRGSRALRRGTRRTVLVEDDVYAFVRASGAEAVLTVLSRGAIRATIPVPEPFEDGDVLVPVLGGDGATVVGSSVTLDLPAEGVLVLRR
jgi:glycosidase